MGKITKRRPLAKMASALPNPSQLSCSRHGAVSTHLIFASDHRPSIKISMAKVLQAEHGTALYDVREFPMPVLDHLLRVTPIHRPPVARAGATLVAVPAGGCSCTAFSYKGPRHSCSDHPEQTACQPPTYSVTSYHAARITPTTMHSHSTAVSNVCPSAASCHSKLGDMPVAGHAQPHSAPVDSMTAPQCCHCGWRGSHAPTCPFK